MFKFDFFYFRKCNIDDLSLGFFFMLKISKSVILNSDFIKKKLINLVYLIKWLIIVYMCIF